MAQHSFPEYPASGYADMALTTTTVARLDPPRNADGQVPYMALVQCQRNTARMRMDGGNPAAGSGFRLAVDDVVVLVGAQIRAARFIADGGAAPTLSVTYFGATDDVVQAAPRA